MANNKKTIAAAGVFIGLFAITFVLRVMGPPSPGKLIAQINNPDRMKAVQQALVQMDVRAVGALIDSQIDPVAKANMLNQMSAEARREAVENVYRLAARGELMNAEHRSLQMFHMLDPDVRGALIEGVFSPDINIKKTFLRIIEKRVSLARTDSDEVSFFAGNERFLFELGEGLSAPDPRLRMYGAALLGKLDVGTLEELGPLLDDEDVEVAEAAAKAMVRLKLTGRLDKILQMAQSPEVHVRGTMMATAVALGGEKARPVLEQNLIAEDLYTRCVAAEKLGTVGNSVSVAKLKSVLEDAPVLLQAPICGALVRLGYPEYYENLIDLLNTTNRNVLKATINNLHLAKNGHIPSALRFGTNAINSEKAKWVKWWRLKQQGIRWVK